MATSRRSLLDVVPLQGPADAFLSAGIKHLIFAVRPDLKPEPSLMDA